MKTGGLHQLQLLGSEPVTNSIKTLWWTEYIMHTKSPSANEDFFYIFFVLFIKHSDRAILIFTYFRFCKTEAFFLTI